MHKITVFIVLVLMACQQAPGEAPKVEEPERIVQTNIVCGDGRCDAQETDRTCPADCVPTCGNNVCEQNVTPYPEHYQNCGDCKPEVCGDGRCSFYETASSCAEDCA